MNEQDWRTQRNSRTLIYAGRILDETKRVTLSIDQEYSNRFDGQIALLTLSNLFSRMTPSLSVDLPDVRTVDGLPRPGRPLRELLMQSLYAADPRGKFDVRPANKKDYVINLNPTASHNVVHGSGWNAYCGRGPSKLPYDDSRNPIGPSMAAILAASQAFRSNLQPFTNQSYVNTLNWSYNPTVLQSEFPPLASLDLGQIWFVGMGSVGSAIVFFLTLATKKYRPILIDHDRVKIQNLDRSPIFRAIDVNQFKVDAIRSWLSSQGISAQVEPRILHESSLWRERPVGKPDVLVSAANEFNVRHVIESSLPPLQIYGTTGRNWQSAVLRHIPLKDPCSLCLFPDQEASNPTLCATASVEENLQKGNVNIDAALPFLSFAAGVMSAAEILKLNLPGYPFSANRVILNTRPFPALTSAPLTLREDCICRSRSESSHKKAILNSKYAAF